MIRAMIVKELRETWWIAGIALALQLLLVRGITSERLSHSHGYSPTGVFTSSTEIPFIGGGFTASFMMIAVLAALALGLRQTLAESASGTYQFLLHRPWRREKFILAKLAVGCGLLLVSGALPIIIYACWAATPGHVAAPFEWSMTLDAWWIWAEIPAAYMAAFLVGVRPAAWLGTRCLPLLAVAMAVGILHLMPWPFVLPTIGLLLTDAALAGMICYVARTRDYS